MKLGQKAIAKLQKWGAFTENLHGLIIEGDTFSVVGQVTDADTRSCSLRELELQPRTLRKLSAVQLKAWGERIAKRVRYLLEAIETVELDVPRGRLLLRSKPPEKSPDGTVTYYEVLLQATGYLTLCRIRYDAASRTREDELMHCTHELLEKLIDDLAATVP